MLYSIMTSVIMCAVRQMEENKLGGTVTRTAAMRKHFVAGEERT
jgi:hypothetical protein